MSARPGPLNLLTDVEGLSVGQAHDASVRTGVTVVLADPPAVAAVDLRGGAPGTRETDLLAPDALAETVDAIVLAGGSVYGLGAGDAVVAELGARGRGFAFRSCETTAPIVPAAILFDLNTGGDKRWGSTPPYPELGRAALAAADRRFTLGVAGAGYGAMAGRWKGGTGSASLVGREGVTVAALACVNAIGSVTLPGQPAFWAWPFEIDGEFGGLRPDLAAPAPDPDDWGAAKARPAPGENTTLAVVATDAALTRAQARRFAVIAQTGLTRAIRPAHTSMDGDVVFALSTGRLPLPGPDAALALTVLGERAATCLARAVARAVFEAAAPPGWSVPTWRAAHGRADGLAPAAAPD